MGEKTIPRAFLVFQNDTREMALSRAYNTFFYLSNKNVAVFSKQTKKYTIFFFTRQKKIIKNRLRNRYK